MELFISRQKYEEVLIDDLYFASWVLFAIFVNLPRRSLDQMS